MQTWTQQVPSGTWHSVFLPPPRGHGCCWSKAYTLSSRVVRNRPKEEAWGRRVRIPRPADVSLGKGGFISPPLATSVLLFLGLTSCPMKIAGPFVVFWSSDPGALACSASWVRAQHQFLFCRKAQRSLRRGGLWWWWLALLWWIQHLREEGPPCSRGGVGAGRPESFCVCRAHGNTPFVKSPLSPYSPLGFLCHEKHYFWIKLNVGVLKIKEQPLCCLLPFQKPFLCLPNAGAPDIEAYWNCLRFSVTVSGNGFILHCFLSLVCLFCSFFSLSPPCCSFMFFLPALYPPSPPFHLSRSHRMSEPKETPNRPVQLPRLPGRKPGSRKPYAWIVGFRRRDTVRVSAL